MSRIFPRFLFSEANNVKSSGQFITHTLDPMFVVRVAKLPNYDTGISTHNGKYILFFQNEITVTKKFSDTTNALFKWIEAQDKMGIIKIKESDNENNAIFFKKFCEELSYKYSISYSTVYTLFDKVKKLKKTDPLIDIEKITDMLIIRSLHYGTDVFHQFDDFIRFRNK